MTWLAATLLLGAATAAKGPAKVPWITASDDGTTRIVYRDIQSANAREVRATTDLKATPEAVWKVVKDFAHEAEFMPYLVQVKKLGPCAGGTVYYERVSPPIISDRDYTVCVKLVADEKTQRFERSWTLANDRGPKPVDGVVRVPVNDGSYQVSPDGKGGTRLVYTVLTNPGGSVPAWIAKRASTSTVPDLFDAIRHRVRDPRWTK